MNSSTNTDAGTTATPQKFVFGKSFDAAALAAAAAAPKPVSLLPDEITALKQQAFAEGEAAGKQAAEAGLLAVQNTILQTIGAELGELQKRALQLTDENYHVIISAIHALAKNMLPHYVQQHGTAEITQLITTTLQQLRDEPRLVVRLAEPQVTALSERIMATAAQTGFTGELVLQGDATLNATDCLLEWSSGGLERRLATIWADIEATCAKNLANIPPIPSPPPATTA